MATNSPIDIRPKSHYETWVMRALVLCACIFVAGACLASEPHHIGGAISNFCLPEANEIADIPWVPPDKPGTSDAFAFAGCATMSGATMGKCGTPQSILGGVVQARAAFHSQKWRDFDPKSMLGRITLSPYANLKAFDNGTIVVVHNEKLWRRDWYVWKKATRLSSKGSPYLEGDDVLLATCHYERPGLECDRSVLARDYALQYTFKSDTLPPENLRGQDAAVMAAIDQWRCAAAR